MVMATREEISDWFDRGVQEGKSHMLVICDTFDWDDYPTFADDEASARQQADSPGEMQKVMEVYNLKLDKNDQLSQRRAMNF